jgi:hypothetical protein
MRIGANNFWLDAISAKDPSSSEVFSTASNFDYAGLIGRNGFTFIAIIVSLYFMADFFLGTQLPMERCAV